MLNCVVERRINNGTIYFSRLLAGKIENYSHILKFEILYEITGRITEQFRDFMNHFYILIK